MKHAVVVSHPRSRSFTLAMARAYESAAIGRGHTVVFRDLYRLRFDPRMSAGELPGANGAAPRADVAAERTLLADVATFAFFYPVWFNTPPAMHKGDLERVFGMGFGYAMGELGSNRPLLTGRRMISFSNSGAPLAWMQETGAWDARTLFDDHLAAVCGLSVVDHVHFGGIAPGLTRENLDEAARTVKETFQRSF